MTLTLHRTPIADLVVVERVSRVDARGSLTRIFCGEELAAAGWRVAIAQINQTVTRTRGTVRGLHYQCPPHAEVKLVSCLRGAVWDVAVDLRRGSPTFMHWHAEELSAENRHAMLIPEGFAHGMQSLTDDAELLYCHSASYAPHAEAGLHPRDPRIGVTWPLPIAALSERDAAHPPLPNDFEGLRL
jgi:dTDP-4-dehydrorhamnose 3,5-epimerase